MYQGDFNRIETEIEKKLKLKYEKKIRKGYLASLYLNLF